MKQGCDAAVRRVIAPRPARCRRPLRLGCDVKSRASVQRSTCWFRSVTRVGRQRTSGAAAKLMMFPASQTNAGMGRERRPGGCSTRSCTWERWRRASGAGAPPGWTRSAPLCTCPCHATRAPSPTAFDALTARHSSVPPLQEPLRLQCMGGACQGISWFDTCLPLLPSQCTLDIREPTHCQTIRQKIHVVV